MKETVNEVVFERFDVKLKQQLYMNNISTSTNTGLERFVLIYSHKFMRLTVICVSFQFRFHLRPDTTMI